MSGLVRAVGFGPSCQTLCERTNAAVSLSEIQVAVCALCCLRTPFVRFWVLLYFRLVFGHSGVSSRRREWGTQFCLIESRGWSCGFSE